MSNLEAMRHSASHLLAMAAIKKYGQVQLAIGPVIENGFYYDFDCKAQISPEDFGELEQEINDLIKLDLVFKQKNISLVQARTQFASNPYKLELIEELAKGGAKEVSIYQTGDFIDLCKGPHVASSSEVGQVKLLKVAGAYWRGNEKNKMLTRVYGTAFGTKEELDKYLEHLEQAQKRDHKKLGKELDLFVFCDAVGSGLPLYTPKGASLRKTIADYSRTLREKAGYQEVHTPQINRGELFEISGHLEKYKENIFEVKSNYSKEKLYLKPMNCPQHIQIYANRLRSYRDLPIRYADFANLYRDEKPGELSGLSRLRAFSQDDGHVFCREDQIESEFETLLELVRLAMTKYEMRYFVRLSLRDEQNKAQYLGSDKQWQTSQSVLENILKKNKVDYEIGLGEAAFYGPKMDIMIKDSLDRLWQLSTIQLDYNLPERFGLEYITQDGTTQRPVMIHSAIIGSPERFMSILIEHFEGNFPLWLAPVQVGILSVNDEVTNEAQALQARLKQEGLRVETDLSTESVSKKIKNAQLAKIPYIIVFGTKEAQSSQLAVRHNNQITNYSLEQLITHLKETIGKLLLPQDNC